MLLKCTLLYVLINCILCEDADVKRGPVELIESRGFGVQVHNVTTADGYILSVFRIVNPNARRSRLKPVILNHGLMSSCLDFLNNAPGGNVDESLATVGNNLGFELAKRGYDVWLANSRGNTFSRNHVTLSTQDKAFWNFSYDEMAKFDLPATIDYVRKATSSETVAYIGHSQGTMIMFALLSEQSKYNRIVRPFIALAPVTTVGFVFPHIRLLAYAAPLIYPFTAKNGEFFSDGPLQSMIAKYCSTVRIDVQVVCENMYLLESGSFDSMQLNFTRMPVYQEHYPAGTSVQNMLHFAQAIRSGRFAKYDYGMMANLIRYHSIVPPVYALEKITNKNIALLHSINDAYADVIDVQLLKSRLKVPLLDDYQVPDVLWTHFDFIWAKSSGDMINSRVIDLLECNSCSD